MKRSKSEMPLTIHLHTSSSRNCSVNIHINQSEKQPSAFWRITGWIKKQLIKCFGGTP